ncbi:MAG: hypothetical protein ACM3O8_14470 [Methylococcaceae bacterium]|nr:hypothetical protein [Prolixibacteraceae bacterium]
MTRGILILLINVIGIFGANAKCGEKHTSVISQYYPHDNAGGEIEFAQIAIVSLGIIEGNDVASNQFTIGYKHIPKTNYSIDRHSKCDFSISNRNLLSFIQKDIHFLSVLLI